MFYKRFRVLRYIAKGGMGEVFEAEDIELGGEHVAIKTILPAIAADPDMIAQFKREIQLSRKVTHPNVCRIFDLVYDERPSGAIAFLTMELLEGEPLSALIQQTGGLPPEQAVPLAQQMAEGLHAAHKAGVVHQDFKPGNVMVAKEGEGYRAVITDFGLAHNVRESQRKTGKSVGTPAYMAPEQIEGKPVSAATDVYALGVVLYELLTGHWPYNAKTPEELQRKKLEEAPVLPSKYVPNLSPEVERVLLRCLAKAPEQRFQSTLDVVQALAPRRTLRRNLAIACVLLVLLAAAAAYQWRKMAASREPVIAVLGFQNNSGSPEYDWLATELSETLASELAESQQIHVVPADDVAQLKTELSVPANGRFKPDDLPQVRGALGANYLLSGSYTVAPGGANSINVDVELQSPRSDRAIALHATGNEGDYRRVVTELSAEIRSQLGATSALSPDAAEIQNIYPSDPEVRKLYFAALDKLRVFDAPAAAQLLQKAAGKDKSNAAIHAALADAWSQLRLDPQAAKEALTAANLADQNSSLPLEYVVLTKARAAEMNKNWDGAAGEYGTLFKKYKRLDYGLRLAAVQTEGSHTAEALQTLQQLSAMPAPLGNDPRIQIAYARTYEAMSNSMQQLQYAQAALDEARRRNSRMMQANAQLQLCWAYRNQGDVDKASTACNEAHDLFTYIGDKVSSAVALNDLATLLADKGRSAEARQLYDKVIATNRAAGATKDYAGANVNAAKAAIMMGKPDDALDYLNAALSASRQVGDTYDEGRARIMRAEVLADQGKLPEAEGEVQQALLLAKQLQDEAMQASALIQLAGYQEETNIPEALKTYTEALRLRTKNQDKQGIATCLNNIGDVLFRSGDLQAAEEHYAESLKMFNELKAKDAAALNILSLAEVDLERRNLSAAEKNALDALRQFQDPEVKDSDAEESAASLLVRIYVAQGKAEAAAPYVERIQKIASSDRDTMFNSRLSIAQYLAATGKSVEALQQLQPLPAQAEAAGRHFIALDARLLLARMRRQTSPHSELETEMAAIRSAARRSGFGLLVAKTETGSTG